MPDPLEPIPDPLEPTGEFLEAAAGYGITFEGDDLANLGRYLAILLETSAKFNLTGITDPAQAWMKHIFDSLTLLPVLAQVEGAGGSAPRMIDVGTGGGVPGIPLAICMPGVSVTLAEATGKKCEFLRQAAAALGLTNVTVVQQRAELLGRDPAHREMYDAAVARAVGPLTVLAELLVPLVRVRGLILAIKGAKAEQETIEAIPALRLLGGVHEQTILTPTGRIVVMSKGMRTPREYPRGDGVPGSKPLGRAER